MTKNTEKNTDRPQNKNLKQAWKKDRPSPNPNGRPKGQRNYSTIYRQALVKLGNTRNITVEEVEDMLVKNGILKAISGDYRFYKDVLDRLYGTAVNKLDNTTEGKPLETKIVVTYKKFGEEDDDDVEINNKLNAETRSIHNGITLNNNNIL